VTATDQFTSILADVSAGRRGATDRLLPLVYDELRSLAEWQLRGERRDHTLQATALVHEVYVRLTGRTEGHWRDRAHFFAVAAEAIRRILVDHARSKKRLKRGGGRERVPLDGVVLVTNDQDVDLVGLDRAMLELAKNHPRKARVVELRFFGGLTMQQIAEVLNTTLRTVERDWQFARAWLYRVLARAEDE